MQVAIASDHGGFRLKGEIIAFLKKMNIACTDLGTYSEEAVDYPDFALKVAEAVRAGERTRGHYRMRHGHRGLHSGQQGSGNQGGFVPRHFFRQGIQGT